MISKTDSSKIYTIGHLIQIIESYNNVEITENNIK